MLSFGPGIAARLPKAGPGTILRIMTETVPDLKGLTAAIGGGPTLVRNGKAMQWSGFQMRHPRTAIGWNKEHIFMVEVDGRQGQLSVGMTFAELAAYMIKHGLLSGAPGTRAISARTPSGLTTSRRRRTWKW